MWAGGEGSQKEGKGEFENGLRNRRDGRRRLEAQRGQFGSKGKGLHLEPLLSPVEHYYPTDPGSRGREDPFSESGLFANRTKVQITREGFVGP